MTEAEPKVGSLWRRHGSLYVVTGECRGPIARSVLYVLAGGTGSQMAYPLVDFVCDFKPLDHEEIRQKSKGHEYTVTLSHMEEQVEEYRWMAAVILPERGCVALADSPEQALARLAVYWAKGDSDGRE